MKAEPGGGDARAALTAAIGAELGEPARRELLAPSSALSERYRSPGADAYSRRLSSAELRAYLATRVPATFAATRRVLFEVASLRPGFSPRSLLDLGAGPGTATWAAADVFSAIERAVLVERGPDVAALGARLFDRAVSWLGDGVEWVVGDVATVSLPESDLVVAAYLLGELGHDRELPALERWWRATRGELVIVEPGTPAGFERLRAARSALISFGAQVTAPCPHDRTCPMTAPDWCHFAVRLERSALHRDLKGARLGYEDEKFSYVAVSSRRPREASVRLVRSPRLHKGHARLVCCEADGLVERVVSRRDGELYKQARAARWGDRIEVVVPPV
ncbi:MAG: small ribosomal subunit Rsm22 family protein [Acidimicrobiales bacterium]